MNQTLAIAMTASPVDPLPFFLPVPLGVTMLDGPSNDRKAAASRPPPNPNANRGTCILLVVYYAWSLD